MPSGTENLTNIIAGCKKLSEGLDKAAGAQGPALKAKVDALLPKLDAMQGKFFLKTIPSIPPTKACLAVVAECQAAKDKKDWAGLGNTVAKLEKAVADLAYKIEMPGTQIT